MTNNLISGRSNLKTIAMIPAWAEAFNAGAMGDTDKLLDTSAAYSKVPLLFRAVNIRCKMLIAIPFHLHKVDSEDPIEWDTVFTTPLKDLIWHIEASKLLAGFCLCIINDNVEAGRRFGLQWLNPATVHIEIKQTKDDNGLPVTERTFTQRVNSVKYGPWTDDQVVFFRDFNPSDDIGKGLAAAQVALGTAQLRHYTRRFASYFFEGGAMPVTVIGVEGTNPGNDEMERVRSFFSRFAKGLRNAFNVIALRGTLKPFSVTPPLNTLDMTGLSELTTKDMAFAFELPETLLTDAANYATAVDNMQSVYTNTVVPRADMICEELNRQYLKDTDYTIEAEPEEMSLFQEDEAERGRSLSMFMDFVDKCKTEEMCLAALEEFGYNISDEMKQAVHKEFDIKQSNAAAAAENMQPKPGGRTGAPVPLDVGNAYQVQGPASAEPAAPAKKSLFEADLAKWERKALKRLKESNSALVYFTSENISDADMLRITDELIKATTVEDVKAVFAQHTSNSVPAYGELVEALRDATKAARETVNV